MKTLEQILNENPELIENMYQLIAARLPDLQLEIGQLETMLNIPRSYLRDWADTGVIGTPRDTKTDRVQYRFTLQDVRKAAWLYKATQTGLLPGKDKNEVSQFLANEANIRALDAVTSSPKEKPTIIKPLGPESAFLDFYDYIVPRLVEACFAIIFGKVKKNVTLVIGLGDPDITPDPNAISNMTRAFVGSVDDNRVIATCHSTSPLIDLDSYDVLSYPLHKAQVQIATGKGPAARKNQVPLPELRQAIDSLSQTDRCTLDIVLHWIFQLARKRETMGQVREFAALHPTEYRALAVHRPQVLVDWLVERGKDLQRAWSFAVILTPRDPVMKPRYLQELETFVCSRKGPYHNNPFPSKREGYSFNAFELGHLINPGRVRRGTVYPQEFESNVSALVAVPTYFNNQINGVLYVASTENGFEFEDIDERLLAIIARITGSLIGDAFANKAEGIGLRNAIRAPRMINPIFFAFKTERDLMDRMVEQLETQPLQARPSTGLLAVDINKSKNILRENTHKLNTQEHVDRFFCDIGTLLNKIAGTDTTAFQTRPDRFTFVYEGVEKQTLIENARRILRRFESYIYDPDFLEAPLIKDLQIRIGVAFIAADIDDRPDLNAEVAHEYLIRALEEAKKRGETTHKSSCFLIDVATGQGDEI